VADPLQMPLRRQVLLAALAKSSDLIASESNIAKPDDRALLPRRQRLERRGGESAEFHECGKAGSLFPTLRRSAPPNQAAARLRNSVRKNINYETAHTHP
jgi:hypothetical protein